MSSRSNDTSSGSATPPDTPSDKPATPYTPGAIITAKRHQAPPPFGRGYNIDFKYYLEEVSPLTQLEWCHTHPPLPGTTYAEDTLHITVKYALRAGNYCGAQILLTEDGRIAKIYDPLYCEYRDMEGCESTVDVTTVTDSDYSNEAAAYTELQHSSAKVARYLYTMDHGLWTSQPASMASWS